MGHYGFPVKGSGIWSTLRMCAMLLPPLHCSFEISISRHQIWVRRCFYHTTTT